MKILKYIELESGKCETPCPYPEKKYIKIGSTSCQICEYFISKDSAKSEIICIRVAMKSKHNISLYHLNRIIDDYKEDSGEPLDGDEVEELIEHFRNYINLREGNITEEEFADLEEDGDNE